MNAFSNLCFKIVGKAMAENSVKFLNSDDSNILKEALLTPDRCPKVSLVLSTMNAFVLSSFGLAAKERENLQIGVIDYALMKGKEIEAEYQAHRKDDPTLTAHDIEKFGPAMCFDLFEPLVMISIKSTEEDRKEGAPEELCMFSTLNYGTLSPKDFIELPGFVEKLKLYIGNETDSDSVLLDFAVNSLEMSRSEFDERRDAAVQKFLGKLSDEDRLLFELKT